MKYVSFHLLENLVIFHHLRVQCEESLALPPCFHFPVRALSSSPDCSHAGYRALLVSFYL